MILEVGIHVTNQLRSSLETVPLKQKNYNNKDDKLAFIASRELSFALIEQSTVSTLFWNGI